jgi:hypothetical protein
MIKGCSIMSHKGKTPLSWKACERVLHLDHGIDAGVCCALRQLLDCYDSWANEECLARIQHGERVARSTVFYILDLINSL